MSDAFPLLLVPGLPNEVSLLIFARFPRSLYPSLSLVCRSWRSALRSPILSDTRRSLCISQPAVILGVRTPYHRSLWFLLDHLQAARAKTLPLPPPPISVTGAADVAVGSSLYLLGGAVAGGVPSRTVQILDAASLLWHAGPQMHAAREFAAAGSIAGKIYAVGGCLPPPEAWSETLDPVSGIWKVVPSPPGIRAKWMHGNAVLGGRLIAMSDHGGVVYNPLSSPSSAWGPVPAKLDLGWKGRAAVVSGILYSYDFLGKIKGYDPEKDEWMAVEGLESRLPKFLHGATLAALGDLLCVVWMETGVTVGLISEMEIIWAGICISRTAIGGLHGSILWRGSAFLDLQKGTSITHCATVEL